MPPDIPTPTENPEVPTVPAQSPEQIRSEWANVRDWRDAETLGLSEDEAWRLSRGLHYLGKRVNLLARQQPQDQRLVAVLESVSETISYLDGVYGAPR